MSLLSPQNTTYDHLINGIANIKDHFLHNSKEQLHKYDMITIKIQMVQQQIQISNSHQLKYQKTISDSIQSFSIQLKTIFKELLQNIYDKQQIKDIQRQLKDLQQTYKKIIQTNNHIQEQYLLRLQKQLNILEDKYNQKIKQYNQEIYQVQSQIKKELAFLYGRLEELKRCNCENQDMVGELEILKKDMGYRMGQIKKRRKERKDHFLNLLENIIQKCKLQQEQDN